MKIEILDKQSGSVRLGNIIINPTYEILCQLVKDTEDIIHVVFSTFINFKLIDSDFIKYYLVGNKYSLDMPAIVLRGNARLELEINNVLFRFIPNNNIDKSYSIIIFNIDPKPFLILNNPLYPPHFLKNNINKYRRVLHFGSKLSANLLLNTVGGSSLISTNSNVDYFLPID